MRRDVRDGIMILSLLVGLFLLFTWTFHWYDDISPSKVSNSSKFLDELHLLYHEHALEVEDFAREHGGELPETEFNELVRRHNEKVREVYHKHQKPIPDWL